MYTSLQLDINQRLSQVLLVTGHVRPLLFHRPPRDAKWRMWIRHGFLVVTLSSGLTSAIPSVCTLFQTAVWASSSAYEAIHKDNQPPQRPCRRPRTQFTERRCLLSDLYDCEWLCSCWIRVIASEFALRRAFGRIRTYISPYLSMIVTPTIVTLHQALALRQHAAPSIQRRVHNAQYGSRHNTPSFVASCYYWHRVQRHCAHRRGFRCYCV